MPRSGDSESGSTMFMMPKTKDPKPGPRRPVGQLPATQTTRSHFHLLCVPSSPTFTQNSELATHNA